MTNKEKFLALVSTEGTNTVAKNRERIRNRAMLRESQIIAMKVLAKLDQLGWTQKRLADELDVKPQQITKIVSGKENLTVDTQIKLQNILNIAILASYYDNAITSNSDKFMIMEGHLTKVEDFDNQAIAEYDSCKIIRLECHKYSEEYDNVAV